LTILSIFSGLLGIKTDNIAIVIKARIDMTAKVIAVKVKQQVIIYLYKIFRVIAAPFSFLSAVHIGVSVNIDDAKR